MIIYAADFETTAPMEDTGLCEVWLAGFCKLHTEDAVIIDGIYPTGCINSFMGACMLECENNKQDSLFYFHNLKYDGCFILYWLLKKGFKATKLAKGEQLKDNNISFLFNRGQWYEIAVPVYCRSIGKWVKLIFRDSLKLLPFSLAVLTDASAGGLNVKHSKLTGTIDYSRHNKRCEITDDEYAYFRHDILGLKEVLEQTLPEKKKPKLTIGSSCFSEYKEMVNHDKIHSLPMRTKNNWNAFFPRLTHEEDEIIRQSYRGGWCYLKKGYENSIIKAPGYTLDVNSLYPSMMHSCSGNLYPVGKMTTYRNKDFIEQQMDCLFEKGYFQIDGYIMYGFVEWECCFDIRPGRLPCIQVHMNHAFNGRDWLTSSKGIVVEMVSTMTDYLLIHEQYNVEYECVKAIHLFRTNYGLFDEYIDKYYDIKKHAKKGSVERMDAKLKLNNLYGKMATAGRSSFVKPFVTEDGILLVDYEEEIDDDRLTYIPIGSAITSYARCFTIRAAQANYKNFVYADTDSIHCVGFVKDAKGVKVDNNDMCCWKLEQIWDAAKFISPKRYVEISNGKSDLKCCGLVALERENFAQMFPGYNLLEAFDPANPIDNGKLIRVLAPGGVYLQPQTYKIHMRETEKEWGDLR